MLGGRQQDEAMAAVPESRSRRRQIPARLTNVRRSVYGMLNARSREDRRIAPVAEPAMESPKTPRLVLGLQNFSSTRLAIPYLNRPSISLPNSPIASPVSSTPLSPRPVVQDTTRPTQQPTVSTVPAHVRHNSERRFVGVDPAESLLAQMADDGRRRRKQRKSKSRRNDRVCGFNSKNKRIRSKVLSCVISGLVLILILAIYLGLALTNRAEKQEFHVLLILIILITTIFFCHSLIRLCMMILHPPVDPNDLERQNMRSMVGPGGYANPVVPIRVTLARDEEAAGIESTATKVPPPVYGLWRESVRVDPNRLYWQRNDAVLQRQTSPDRPSTATRPPSYISEDGVGYVVNAVPRSTAPTYEVPLPVHPSERGRVVI